MAEASSIVRWRDAGGVKEVWATSRSGSYVTEALWTPPINLYARKILAVNCDLRDDRSKASYDAPAFGFPSPQVEFEKLHIG